MVKGTRRKPRETSTRKSKLENLIVNHSLIIMGSFEEEFSVLADRITGASLETGESAMANEFAGAVTGRAGSIARESGEDDGTGGLAPLVRAQIAQVFGDLREEITSQWPENDAVVEKYISSADFDKGIAIVERYDFGRPKLTESLSDEILTSYVFLLLSGDKEISRMFQELAEWQAVLPRPPWAA